MFNILKKKSHLDKLVQQHKDLLEEAYKVSKIDRKKSDQLMYDADLIGKKIDGLKNNS